MANFYDIHKKAIERAFNMYSRRPGDCFNVMMQEPLAPVTRHLTMSETTTILTFRVLPESRYEPARPWDREAIEGWNKRHKYDANERWELPAGLFAHGQ